MKKLIIVFMVILSLLWQGASSQNLIAVQNGGKPEFYTSMDSALVYAQNGDTLFLPGGYFLFNNVNINKRIHIIGVGHNPDSTVATGPTNIMLGASLNISSGASGGSLIGVRLHLAGIIYFGENVSNFRIGSCYLWHVYLQYPTDINNLLYNNVITGRLEVNSSQSNFFYNNIIESYVNGGNQNVFKNNVFLNGSGVSTIGYTTYCIVENNVFFKPNGASTVYGYFDIYNNNLFVENISFPANSCPGNNNIVNQVATSIFVNQSGNSFNYSHDYHLQQTCPGKNAGKDGTDIGIYGGVFPWKEGSIPFNPHFQSLQIAPTTDSTGNLNVNIKVAAQDR